MRAFTSHYVSIFLQSNYKRNSYLYKIIKRASEVTGLTNILININLHLLES